MGLSNKAYISITAGVQSFGPLDCKRSHSRRDGQARRREEIHNRDKGEDIYV